MPSGSAPRAEAGARTATIAPGRSSANSWPGDEHSGPHPQARRPRPGTRRRTRRGCSREAPPARPPCPQQPGGARTRPRTRAVREVGAREGRRRGGADAAGPSSGARPVSSAEPSARSAARPAGGAQATPSAAAAPAHRRRTHSRNAGHSAYSPPPCRGAGRRCPARGRRAARGAPGGPGPSRGPDHRSRGRTVSSVSARHGHGARRGARALRPGHLEGVRHVDDVAVGRSETRRAGGVRASAAARALRRRSRAARRRPPQPAATARRLSSTTCTFVPDQPKS